MKKLLAISAVVVSFGLSALANEHAAKPAAKPAAKTAKKDAPAGDHQEAAKPAGH